MIYLDLRMYSDGTFVMPGRGVELSLHLDDNKEVLNNIDKLLCIDSLNTVTFKYSILFEDENFEDLIGIVVDFNNMDSLHDNEGIYSDIKYILYNHEKLKFRLNNIGVRIKSNKNYITFFEPKYIMDISTNKLILLGEEYLEEDPIVSTLIE